LSYGGLIQRHFYRANNTENAVTAVKNIFNRIDGG